MPMSRLVRPSEEWREEYIAFYEDWNSSGEKMVPWVIAKEPYSFEEMLQYLSDGEKETEGLVPHSTYWLIDDDNQVVGVVNIRHRLNEKLLLRGGNIGYGIRPSARRKGHATRILSLALGITKAMGLDRALVTCDRSNEASARTIVKNGGKLDSEYVEDNGNVVLRFWIDLQEEISS
ncbi:GNAT family N-acetyltransferase [Paenibacillus sp. GD4]|nr:GNAT family N-acetyltransferase [Paenibacillus sp. GD4]MDQ1914466.1 GNAT family N-acetyltransferase [Paenibacillus sp. GD4]